MATIKDVAKLAGVSIATVSNYINQTKPVSKELSWAIREAIDTLHYQQNLNARSLKSSTGTDIGIILPDLNDSYYVQIFQGINSHFMSSPYYLNVDFSRDIPEFEQNIADSFSRKKVRGLIMVSCRPEKWKYYYDNFTSANIPVVLIDRTIENLDANFVSFDNRRLMKEMTEKLIAAGIDPLVLFSGPERFRCEAECIRGFFDAYAFSGLSTNRRNCITTDMSKEDAFRKTVALLKQQIPRGVVSTSESLAEGIMEGIRVLGYSTDSIPVFTLSEDHWNLHTHSLSSGFSMRRPIQLGRTAAHLLERQMLNPLTRENETVILDNQKEHSVSFRWNRRFPAGRSVFPETGSGSDNPKPQKKIRVLALDTPQVTATMGLVKNFTDRTGIMVDAKVLPHHLLYEEILHSFYGGNGSEDTSSDRIGHEQGLSSDDDCTDIFMYDLPWLPSLAAEGILANISEETSRLDEHLFLPGSLDDYGRFDDACYGLPFMYAPQILYYRKDLFENPALRRQYESRYRISLRPPKTLKEFNTVAEFFTLHTDAVPYSLTVPTAYSECLTPEIYMRLRSYGARLFDHAGKVCLYSTQALAAYNNFAGILKFARPDYRTATDISAVHDFLSGETSMLISYPSFLADVTDLRKSSMIGSIGYSRIPGGAPLLGGWGLGINSRSRKKDEAMQFILWTCDEQIANYSVLLGGLPAIAGAYQNDELTQLCPWLPLYREVYQSCRPTMPPTLPGHKVIPQYETDKIVCNWVNRMLDERLEVQDVVKGTHRDLEELVLRYRM